MFYGTDYKVGDLPVPRQSHHEWALMHEESPKNNYLFSHRDTMVLFNHTCTFRRNSHYPITTQHLENLQDLESSQYLGKHLRGIWVDIDRLKNILLCGDTTPECIILLKLLSLK